MKKLLFCLLFSFCTAIAFCQVSFKIGLINSLSIDESVNQNQIVFGSVIGEADYSISGTVAATFNAGFLRFNHKGEGFQQFPLLIGTKYRLNETFYFGGAAGAAWYFKNRSGTDFIWSAFGGLNVKDFMSIDLRYLNAIRNEDPTKNICLVISYNF